MNNRLKISLLLTLTLVIGIIIGFLISGRLVSHRIETMRNHYSETGFGREIMRVIKPTPEQKEEIGPIFREYAEKNRELMYDYHEGQKDFYKELKEDLEEVLDPEQINRLDDHWKNRKRWNDDRKSRSNNRKNRSKSGR